MDVRLAKKRDGEIMNFSMTSFSSVLNEALGPNWKADSSLSANSPSIRLDIYTRVELPPLEDNMGKIRNIIEQRFCETPYFKYVTDELNGVIAKQKYSIKEMQEEINRLKHYETYYNLHRKMLHKEIE